MHGSSDELMGGRTQNMHAPSVAGLVARLALGLFLVAVLVAFILGFGELEKFLTELAGVKWEWIAVAAAIQTCTYLCAAGVWHEVMKHSGHRMGLRSLVPLTVAQLFARQTVPSAGISGAAMATRGLLNRGLSETEALGCILVSLVSFTAAYVAAVVVALLLLGHYHHVSVALLVAASLFVLMMLAIPGVVFWLYRRGLHQRIPRALARIPPIARMLEVLPQVPLTLLHDSRLLVKATLLQLAVFVIDSATLAVMLVAIGHPLGFGWVFAAHVMASAIGTIAPVPLGLGTYEGAGVGLLHAAGLPMETALAAVLLLRGFTFWLPMLPGFFLTRRELNYARR